MKNKRSSTKEIIKKFSDFFSFFKDKSEIKKEKFILSTEISLADIESFDYIDPGDVVLHKNIKLYKIVDFGKVQIAGQWRDVVYYIEVFKTDFERPKIYSRTEEDFVKSFKKILTFGDLELRIKR